MDRADKARFENIQLRAEVGALRAGVLARVTTMESWGPCAGHAVATAAESFRELLDLPKTPPTTIEEETTDGE